MSLSPEILPNPQRAAALHHDLVAEWVHSGPDEVYLDVSALTASDLVNLVMMYIGRDALRHG